MWKIPSLELLLRMSQTLMHAMKAILSEKRLQTHLRTILDALWDLQESIAED